ncbi:MAG: 16S rRNA (adenine(1518)-N(6)/adenine(1519)-N(6))-dimethyltransferase RsmA [Myxococcota bacterium]
MIESPVTVLRRHGLEARKSWGQHFLHAMHVHASIAKTVGASEGQRVVEIGCGLGTLTAHLLTAGADVWGIERDRDLCGVLRKEFGEVPNFTLHETDAVKFDYRSAAEDGVRPHIAGNLPYHLTGPLLFRFLEAQAVTGPWVILIQKEVAQRLCAGPGSKTYGGITVGLSRVRDISMVMHVPPGAFAPPPKVDSAVVLLNPRTEPRGEVPDEARFLSLVRTAFQMRRKTISNALRPLGSRDEVEAWCQSAGIDPKLRPERIEVEGFAALARARDA